MYKTVVTGRYQIKYFGSELLTIENKIDIFIFVGMRYIAHLGIYQVIE
jgi:hypothetical protein